jgi:hypothetical protein
MINLPREENKDPGAWTRVLRNPRAPRIWSLTSSERIPRDIRRLFLLKKSSFHGPRAIVPLNACADNIILGNVFIK